MRAAHQKRRPHPVRRPHGHVPRQLPEGDTAAYSFNKHVIRHVFCPTCGIRPYGEGKAPNGDEMAAVNIRCIDGVDLVAVPVHHYDGRAT